LSHSPAGRRMCSTDHAAVEFSAKTASPLTCDVAVIVFLVQGLDVSPLRFG
jgi:hypothetical protein